MRIRETEKEEEKGGGGTRREIKLIAQPVCSLCSLCSRCRSVDARKKLKTLNTEDLSRRYSAAWYNGLSSEWEISTLASMCV